MNDKQKRPTHTEIPQIGDTKTSTLRVGSMSENSGSILNHTFVSCIRGPCLNQTWTPDRRYKKDLHIHKTTIKRDLHVQKTAKKRPTHTENDKQKRRIDCGGMCEAPQHVRLFCLSFCVCVGLFCIAYPKSMSDTDMDPGCDC